MAKGVTQNMGAIIDKIRINQNGDNHELCRNRKLKKGDREKIRREYFNAHDEDRPTQTALAKKYNVDRRLIQFILFPEREERHKALAKERSKDGRYYNREKGRMAMREYRDYKRKLVAEGKLHIPESKKNHKQ